MLYGKKNPFKLSEREQISEVISVAFVLLILIGSFLKVLFL